MSIGNEENMDKVRELMNQSEKVNIGSDLRNAVTIDYMSEYGNEYKGIVEFKKPNMRDYMKMGAIKSEILREAGIVNVDLVDGGIIFMAHCLSALKVVMVRCPQWLMDLDSIEDGDLITHVYGKYLVFENSFRRNGGTEQEGDSTPAEGAPAVDASEAVRG